MREFTRRAVYLVASFLVLSVLCEAQSFRFGFVLESPGSPDFDDSRTIDGARGESFTFGAVMTLGSSGLTTTREGVQGWSCSIWTAGVSIADLSVEGTVSASQEDGGLVEAGEKRSFVQFETVDPAKNAGREGLVQAIVPSFFSNITLPLNTVQLIGKIIFEGTIPGPGVVAFVRYEDGLRGSGQPVENGLTVSGATQHPSLGQCDVTIGEGAVPETGKCADGIDNDGDGWTDCADPSCDNDAGCGSEDCTDGIDNDRDGETDCEDSDCGRNEACQEDCGDGRDNDFDGKTDCDDADCLGRDPCPVLEICEDDVDNDEDGDTDCDDSDCLRHPVCRVPEDCDDGVDNDLDGRVDCDDRDCIGVPPCPFPENCDDDIDNDEDGFTDCDDTQCAALSRCRKPEDCDDGIDNDVDGRVDCDDFECAGVPSCPPREICHSGADEDGDGLVDCADPHCEAVAPCGARSEQGFDLVLASERSFREREGSGGGASHRGFEKNVLEVPIGSQALIEVVTYIIPFPQEQSSGAQGWSVSVGHDRRVMEIQGTPTIEGTDAWDLFTGGFQKTEVAEAEGAGGGAGAAEDDLDTDADGYISAVVLSFTEPITLDPTRAQSITRASYRLKTRDGGAGGGAGTEEPVTGAVGFRDGLRGSGQPVTNTLTIGGNSVTPTHLVPIEIRQVRTDFPFLRGDVNDDGNYDVSDPIFLVQYRFLRGPVLPAPFPVCGSVGEMARDSLLTCPEGASRCH